MKGKKQGIVNGTTSLNENSEEGTQSLPSDFFEKVIDLELKLAQEFNISTVQELSNLFMVKIVSNN